jgi:DHA1 family tetracycline resistance protein-like MFS transporter
MTTSRWRVAIIFLTVLIDLIGFGIVLPILPYYSQTFGAEGLGFGVLIMSFSAMQFLATAVLGRLSDRIGRRPILLTTTLFNAAGYVMFAFAESYAVLLLARVISGFAGGNISVAQAYMADVSPPADRSRRMGLLGAAFGLGFSIGPLVGAVAALKWGHAGPGVVAAALSLANFVSAYFILPESLGPEHRARRRLLDFGHFGEVLSRPRLRPLMVVWGLAPFAFAGYTVVLPLFAGVRFGWGTPQLGVFFGEVGITAALVQGVLFGKLARRYGDRRLVIAGTCGMALGIGLVPLMGSTFALYAWTLVLAFSNSLFAPAATGLVSLYAGPAEQGTVLGAAQAIAALGRMTGPIALGWGYDRAGGTAAFVVAGAVMALAAATALRLERLIAATPAASSPVPARDSGHSAAS